MEELKLYSAGELAKLLNISRQNLAYKIKKGKIKPVPFIKSRYKFFSELEVRKALLWRDSKNPEIQTAKD